MHTEGNFMTIGIYKLVFSNTDKVYVGQSNCIEKRWISHNSTLRLNKGAIKLQEAYDTYGLSHYEILCECTIEELDEAELEAIEIYDSYYSGFNGTPYSTGPAYNGEDNPSALESNETYKEVLRLLVHDKPSLSKKEVSELLNVSIYTVRHIASLETHMWLKEEMPDEYSKLEKLKSKKYYRGNQYPQLVSPEGVVFEITHITNFAKEHGLSQPKVTEIMKGTRTTHKGWRLA